MQTLRRAQAWMFGALLLAPALGWAQTAGSASATAARNEAGKIELITGNVTVTAPDRTSRAPKQGEMLFEGDAIATGTDGELHAEMLDSGVIAVRPNTQMRITKYQAQGDANDTSIFGLVKGSFRSITGWIGRNNPDKYRINTPTATIGVRGTDHEPLVIPEGSRDGNPGTYDKVATGGSFIQGQSGRVDVTPGRAGFFAHNGRERPRLLESVPAVFRPGRSDSRLEGRHERVRATMESRRTERREFIRQRNEQRRQQGQPGQGAQREQRNTPERREQARELREQRQQERAQRQQQQQQQHQQQQAQQHQNAQAQRQQLQQQRQQAQEQRQQRAQERQHQREQQHR